MNELDYYSTSYRARADAALMRLGVPERALNELGQAVPRVDALEDVWASMAALCEAVQEESYDAGYETGNNDGYTDGFGDGMREGYRDGYADCEDGRDRAAVA